MPIKPENKARYPKDWKLISQKVRENAGNKCEFCGIENGAIGWRDYEGLFVYAPDYLAVKAGKGNYYQTSDRLKIVLTVAHLNHIVEDCSEENLKALCQKCHLNYDAKHHQQNARNTREKKKGLLSLF